jgi:hypothetical protein
MDGEVQIGIIYKICQFCDGWSLNKLRRCSKILMENMKAKFPKFVNAKAVEMVVKYGKGKDSKSLFMYWNNAIVYEFFGASEMILIIENHFKSLENDRKLKYPESDKRVMSCGIKIEKVLEDDQTEKFGAENQQMLRNLLYKENDAPTSEDQYKAFFELLGSELYQTSLEHLEAKSFVDSKGS